MRLGVLDVGSNTVHFLVVDAHQGGRPLPVFSHKAELHLGDSLENGKLSRSVAVRLRGFVARAAAPSRAPAGAGARPLLERSPGP